VILIDANLLIYAHVNNLPQHFAAKGWLDKCLNASALVGLPWPSLLGFLRIVTNPRIFERPVSIMLLRRRFWKIPQFKMAKSNFLIAAF